MSNQQDAFAAAVNESWRRGRRTGLLEGFLLTLALGGGLWLWLGMS